MAWGPQALFITPAYSVASGAKGELSWQGPSVTRCLTCLLFSLSPNLPLATQWDAFSIPELQNFLTILEKEEQDKVQQVQKKYNKFRKKLEEVSAAEGFYEWSFYLIFSMLNVYVQTQVKCARGRADMVVFMPDAIYVMELKINGTARDALDQIENKGYALRYATDGRRIVKVGMGFSVEKRAMTEYIIVE